MTTAVDIAVVDAFLADPKTLAGSPPEFGPSGFHRRGNNEWAATWPLRGSHGVVETGQLRFVAGGFGLFSISLLFKSQAISRLDYEDESNCESNPPWAQPLMLPAVVCGPHFHSWLHNRGHVLASGQWTLPAREALPVQVRRFEQAFPWLAERINLVLSHEERQFELPSSLV
jgi:hypothetical protein